MILATLCLFGISGLAAAENSSLEAPRLPPPLLSTEAARTLGPAELSWLRDPGGRLHFEQVLAPEMAARFQPAPNGLSLGFTDDALWLRIDLRRARDSSDHWRLELTSSLLNDIRLFERLPDGTVRVEQAGDRFSFADRRVAYRRPVFDLALPDDQLRSFFVRIHTDSTVTLRLVAWEPSAFQSMLQWDSLWMGALIGIVAISVFFFLQAWLMNRDQLLLAAAAVTLAFALTAASNLGLLFQYVLPQLPVLADLIQTLSMALFFPLLFALFGRALSVREMVPWVHRIQYLASALCIGAGVSRLFDLYSAFGGKLMMLGMLGGLGWINATAWISWKRRSRGLPTAVALSLFTTSFALAPIVALGLVPPFRYFELFWVVGSVGFIVLAQMTTLAEVRSARIQRRAADSRAAEASRLAEQEATWRQQQSVYFAGVAHDVRTPLNALSVGLRNLERSLAPVTVSVGERLDRLQSSTRRLAEMIERHLQMLRLEQPGFELILAPMPIDDCIGQVRAAVSDAWPDRPIEVVVRDGAPATSVFDGELIVRALINLLSNAAIAAPPGTPIELEVVGDGEGGVGFSVLDSGLGLVGHQLEQLVKVNWRRSRATGGKLADLTGGFGLGLPMAQIIATLHGGRIEYRRQFDRYTVFTLWLPKRPTSV